MPSTPRQLIDQATRHAVYLERYKSGAVKEYAKLLGEMERHIVSNLAKEDITSWSRKRLEKQLKVIRNAMSEVTGDVTTLMAKQVDKLASYEARFELKSLGNLDIKFDFDLPSDSQLKSAIYSRPLQVTGADGGILLGDFFEGWSERSITRIENAIRLGYAQGKTTQRLIRDMYASGGAGDLYGKDLDAVVRTGLAHAAQGARNATWNANSDIIRGVRIVSTLDSQTTDICRGLDGQAYPIDKGPRPPFHLRCRTTTVAELDDRFAILDEGGTRTARGEDGDVESVPAKETYYGWLKRQPAEFQDSVIGKTRGKLLRDGGLTAQQFAELQLGKRFEPMTLVQMEKMDPVAFKKAGIEL
jgi:SPP1 gp7 family putative phage head morphogenesis protein